MSTMDDVQLPDQIRNADIVREKRGMSRIDPTRIEGFSGPEADPVPEYKNPYPEIPAPDTQTHTYDEAVAQFNLIQPVRDAVEVYYQGNKVAYNEGLMNAVEKLILAEGRKEIDARLKELSKPKREQVVRTADAVSPRVEGPAPRKRGRPKGAKNKPKTTPEQEQRIETLMADEVPT